MLNDSVASCRLEFMERFKKKEVPKEPAQMTAEMARTEESSLKIINKGDISPVKSRLRRVRSL